MTNSSIGSVLSTAVTTLKEAQIPSPTLDAEVLLCHVLGQSRAWILAHDDSLLEAEVLENYRALIARRALFEPVAYLTGHKEFFGREFLVTPDVLIPRADTEILVESALEDLALLQQEYKAIHLVDVGTGSGCILLSLLRMTQGLQAYGIDVSPQALEVAQANHRRMLPDIPVTWLPGSLLEPLSSRLPEMSGLLFITANLPYIAEEERDNLVADIGYEPDLALFAADQGSALIARLLEQVALITHLDIVIHVEAASYNLDKVAIAIPAGWEARRYSNLARQIIFMRISSVVHLL